MHDQMFKLTQQYWTTNQIFLLCICCFVLTAIYLPPHHNPDANVYYLVTIRLLAGDFSGSIDGIIGPLLSWLMALPAFVGFSLPSSYRIVQVFFFAVLTRSFIGISALYSLPKWALAFGLFVIFFQCGLSALTMVTSDLALAAVLTYAVWLYLSKPLCFRRSICIGVFGGLAYLCKALGIALFMSWMTSEFLRELFGNRNSRIFLFLILSSIVSILVSAPWIVVLTLRYGIFNIAINPFIGSKFVSVYNYFIDFPLKEAIRTSDISGETISSRNSWILVPLQYLQKFPEYFYQSVEHLILNDSFLVGGKTILVLFILLLLFSTIQFLLKYRQVRSSRDLVAFSVVYFITYAALGGYRLRYYLGVIPALTIIISTVIFRKSGDSSIGPKSLPFYRIVQSMFFRLFYLSCASIPIVLWTHDLSLSRDEVSLLARNPTFEERRGPITGEYWDQRAGYLAAILKREYRGSLRLEAKESSIELQKRLNNWGIEQVLLFNQSFPEMDKVLGFEKKVYTAGTTEYAVYTRNNADFE